MDENGISTCLETLLPQGHVQMNIGGCAPPLLSRSVSIADSCMEETSSPPVAYLFLVASLQELKLLLEKASCNHKRWYPAVWTVVVFCSTHLRDNLVLHAFNILWLYSVYNSAFLLGQNGSVFRADPFARGSRCGKEVVQVFATNCSYYTCTGRTNFPECDFHVSARNSFPFSFLKEGDYYGSDVLLARLIASSSGLKIHWSTRPSPQSANSDFKSHAYYENMTRNDIDLAIGGPVLNYKYFFNVTYGFSHCTQYLLFYVADGKELRGWRLLVGMYPVYLWSWILIAIIFSITGLSFFGTKSISRNFLTVFGILLEQPVKLPHGKLRIILLSIVVPFHCLSFIYTTYLHSLTMNPPKNCGFNTVYDIIEKNATVMVSETNLMLTRRAFANTIVSPGLEESVRLLDERQDFVLLERDLAMRYLLTKTGYRIHSIPYTVANLQLGLVFSKGSVFGSRIQSVIVRCVESGLCDLWIKDILGRIPKRGPSLTTRPITVSDVDSAFTILAIGLLMASFVFVGEIMAYKIASYKKRRRIGNNH